MMLGAQNQIGQVTVTASTQGAIRLSQIAFSQTGTPGLTVGNAFIAIGNNQIPNSNCAPVMGAGIIACNLFLRIFVVLRK